MTPRTCSACATDVRCLATGRCTLVKGAALPGAPKRPAKASTVRALAIVERMPLEHEEQAAFFDWIAEAKATTPELDEFFAVPNFTSRLGKNPPVALLRQAAQHNREGRKKGVEDAILLVARGGYHGLLVEFKRQGATDSAVSPEQRRWHRIHVRRGYAVHVAKGCEDAKRIALAYLAEPPTKVVPPKAVPPRRSA